MTASAWLEDNAPIGHKIARILIFLTSFSWTFNPIQDYIEGGAPIEKILTRMVPMACVAAYCLFCGHARRIKQIFRPGLMPVLWYVAFGVACGLAGAQPALCAWKGAEILILLMWVSVSCTSADATRREFVAMTRLIEILLAATVLLAIANPSLGLRRSASILPWLQGYFPILNPNAVGFLSAAVIARLLFFSAKAKPLRLAFAACTLVCSQSRTSYAVTVAILAVFIIDGLRERQTIRAILALSGMCAMLLLLLGQHDAFVRIVTRGQSAETMDTLSGRTDYWDFALRYVSWTGNGLATGSRSLIFVQGQETFMRGSVNLHNSYIEALIGAGIIGAAPYILLMAANIVRQGYRALAHPSVSQGLFLVMAIVFAARSMTSVVLAIFSYDMLMLMIFFAWLSHAECDRAPGAKKWRPKPVVYERSLYDRKTGPPGANRDRLRGIIADRMRF